MPLDRIPPGSKYGDEAAYTTADALHAEGKHAEAIKALGDDESAPALVRKARWLGEQATMSKELKPDEKLRLCRDAVDFALQAVEKDPNYSTAQKVVAIAKGRVTEFADTSEKIRMSKEIKAGENLTYVQAPQAHCAQYSSAVPTLLYFRVLPFCRKLSTFAPAIDRAIEMDPDDSASWHVLAKWNVGISKLGWLQVSRLPCRRAEAPSCSADGQWRDNRAARRWRRSSSYTAACPRRRTRRRSGAHIRDRVRP